MPTKNKKTQLDRIEEATKPANALGSFASQLTSIEHAVKGNDREGLLERATRLETLMLAATENSLRNSTAIADLKESIHVLSDSIAAHHKTTHLDTLIRKTKFWVVVFAALVGFNLLSRYIPGFVTLVFQLLGVPNVHIPLE